MIQVGRSAPEFTLPDHEGALHSLADYRKSWVLLYFYPKDDTPGCTTEACTIRDSYQKFAEAGIIVLGVSCDSVESHAKFMKKYELPFTLLADEKKELVKAYNVWHPKSMFGRQYMGTLRTSFLIDPHGKVAKIYEKVKPAEHAEEVLSDVSLLSS